MPVPSWPWCGPTRADRDEPSGRGLGSARTGEGCAMPTWVRNNALSIVLFGLFAIFLVGQSLTGWRAYNSDQRSTASRPRLRLLSDHGALRGGHLRELGERVPADGRLRVLTVWLVQKGSSESKPPTGDRSWTRTRGRSATTTTPRGRSARRVAAHAVRELPAHRVRRAVPRCRSTLHALGGAREYNAEQMAHGGSPVSVGRFVTTSAFWFQSFQNWQSEFLAVGTIVVLSIFLRQRGHRSRSRWPRRTGRPGTDRLTERGSHIRTTTSSASPRSRRSR